MGYRSHRYGDDYASAESEIESTTTNTAWENKVGITTPTLQAGDYVVRATAQLGSSNKANGSDVRLNITGGATASKSANFHPSTNDISDKICVMFRKVVTLASDGTITADIDYKSTVGADTAAIQDAVIEIHRVK